MSSSTGKAVHLKSFGMPANVEIVSVPVPTPAAGSVVIRMKLCPVNPADIFSVLGVYPGFQPASLPAVPGLEGMGVVAAVGAGVDSVAVGQRVVPFLISELKAGRGSFREYIEVPATHVFQVPDAVSDEAAAQLVVNPFTALRMIRRVGVQPGGWLLQSAAGSALGRQVIQICKATGIKTANVVRRAEVADELRALGADLVLVQDVDDIAAKVKEATGGAGAWGAIDAVGGDLTARLSGAVRNGGSVIIYGALSGLSFAGSIVDCLFRGVVVEGYWLAADADSAGLEAFHGVAKEVLDMIAAGKVDPGKFTGTVYPLEKAADALVECGTPAHGGKVLLSFQ